MWIIFIQKLQILSIFSVYFDLEFSFNSRNSLLDFFSSLILLANVSFVGVPINFTEVCLFYWGSVQGRKYIPKPEFHMLSKTFSLSFRLQWLGRTKNGCFYHVAVAQDVAHTGSGYRSFFSY